MEDKINQSLSELQDMLENADLTEDQKAKIKTTIENAKNTINSTLNISEEEKGTKSNQYLHVAIGILAFIFVVKLIK
jgi:hypothetical protein